MLYNRGVFCLSKVLGIIGKDVVWNNIFYTDKRDLNKISEYSFWLKFYLEKVVYWYIFLVLKRVIKYNVKVILL